MENTDGLQVMCPSGSTGASVQGYKAHRTLCIKYMIDYVTNNDQDVFKAGVRERPTLWYVALSSVG